MAGEKQGKDDLFDGFLRFYKAQKIDGNCQVCGGDSWTVTDRYENEHIALASFDKTSDGTMQQGSSVIPVITLVCRNCYAVRLHAELPIRDWIDNNPPQDNDKDAQE